MNKKHIAIAALVGLLVGATYASKVRMIPVVGPALAKLPGQG